MMSSKRQRPVVAALLATTMMGGLSAVPALAQDAAQPAASVPAVAPAAGTIRSINVVGQQRLEPDTVLSYTKLRIGQPFTQESLDQALRDLYETELFADVQIRNDNGALTIEVKENPVINRIVLEGNKRLKEDKIRPEIKLAPRQIYTRSKVRADVARIIELYRRQGRFAATVEPKMVQLDQNRVDIVFEISEGPKSKVRQINIIGNDKFNVFSSGTSYDPDRLAYDQQKLRQFYLTEGYADFRVISAVAELTPDKQDFIITYVVEEGQRYKFGDVKVESDIRDLSGASLTKTLPMKKGDWYNAKQVEDTVDTLSQTAGLFGYAFADVQPDFNRDKDSLTMGINFRIANAPRVYVERVDINGNTLTQDKVVRSTASSSSGRRTASTRLVSFRKSWTSNRSRAPRPTASCWKPTSRKNRPASCRCRQASPRWSASSLRLRSPSATSAARARNCAPASIIPAIPSRSKWALPSPISWTRISRWAAISIGVI